MRLLGTIRKMISLPHSSPESNGQSAKYNYKTNLLDKHNASFSIIRNHVNPIIQTNKYLLKGSLHLTLKLLVWGKFKIRNIIL